MKGVLMLRVFMLLLPGILAAPGVHAGVTSDDYVRPDGTQQLEVNQTRDAAQAAAKEAERKEKVAACQSKKKEAADSGAPKSVQPEACKGVDVSEKDPTGAGGREDEAKAATTPWQQQGGGFSQAGVQDSSKLYAPGDTSNVQTGTFRVDNNKLAAAGDIKMLVNPEALGNQGKLSTPSLRAVGGDVIGTTSDKGKRTTITAYEVNLPTDMVTNPTSLSDKAFSDKTTTVGLASHVGSIDMENRNKPVAIPLGQAITFDSKAYLANGTIDSQHISSGFGDRASTNSVHRGIDYTGSREIRASANGVVTRVDCRDANGYGCQVVIDHGKNVFTRYGHLSAQNVKVGDQVVQGQNIGTMGNTGGSQGTHLHYEILAGSTAKGSQINSLDADTYNTAMNKAFGDSVTTGQGNPMLVASNIDRTQTAGTGNGSGSGSYTPHNSGLGTNMVQEVANAVLGNGVSGGNAATLLGQLMGLTGGSTGMSAGGDVTNLLVAMALNKLMNGGSGSSSGSSSGGNSGSSPGASAGGGASGGVDVAVAQQALCGNNLTTASDADTLKVNVCRDREPGSHR